MKFIKKLDYFSKNIQIKFKNENQFSSYFGAVLTILVGYLAILSIIYFSEDMIKKRNPNINESQLYREELEYFNLKENDIFFTFSIWSKLYGTEFIDESVFTIDGYYYIKNDSLPLEMQVERIKLNFEPCTMDHIPTNKESYNFFKRIPLSKHFCMNKKSYEKLTIHGQIDDSFFKKLVILIEKCSNSSKIICKSNEKINEILNENYLHFYYTYNEIDPTNYKIPKVLLRKLKTCYFTINESIDLTIKLQPVDLITDKGYLIKDEFLNTFARIQEVYSEVHEIQLDLFAKIHIVYSKDSIKIIRIYEKLPSILAKIGGIFNLILIILNYLIKPIVDNLFLNDVINNYFYFKLNKKDLNDLDNKYFQHKRVKSKVFTKIKTNIFAFNDLERIKDYFYKIKSNFFELVLSKYFKFCLPKKKKFKQSVLLRLNEEIDNKFDYIKILEKIFEIDLIKKIIFNENQLSLFNKLPKFICQFNRENYNKKTLENSYETILSKDTHSEIDKKLLKMYINSFKN